MSALSSNRFDKLRLVFPWNRLLRSRADAAGCRSSVDPLERFLRIPRAKQEPTISELEEAHQAYTHHVATGTWDEGLERLGQFISKFPHIVRFQVLAVRLLEAANRRESARLAWQGIQQRFPSSEQAFLLHLASTRKHRGAVFAELEVLEYFRDASTSFQDRFLEARAWDAVGDVDRADKCYKQCLEAYQDNEDAYLGYISFLVRRGSIYRAWHTAKMALTSLGASASTRLNSHFVDLNADMGVLLGIASKEQLANTRASHLVLQHLFQLISAARANAVDTSTPSFLGSVVMINSSLGAGGAERQFVNTAIGLQQAANSGGTVAGVDVLGPIEVFCKSLTKKKGADFFEPLLKQRGIPVTSYGEFENWGGDECRSIAAKYKSFLKFLPPSMADGVSRLTDVLRMQSPSVVHIWQDGSIFSTVLAALLAEVPRIVLSVRTLPPIDRPDRYLPEYEVLYPELLKLPGVVLSANSRFAANRYARWIGVDDRRIPVVYNGIDPFSLAGSQSSERMFAGFESENPGASITVGTVMRIDENKRPFVWLESASQFLKLYPQSRFIIVGDGPLRAEAEAYAHRLGLGTRVLFTGISNEVGFWLSKFDIFMLLSQFEGLPNVLIEAQFAGVPVVTTLAGGAGEALIPGSTGITLDNSNLSPEDVCVALAEVIRMRATDPNLPSRARRFASDTFSIEQMMVSTVNSYLGGTAGERNAS